MPIVIDHLTSDFDGLDVNKASDGPITVKLGGVLSTSAVNGGNTALNVTTDGNYSIVVDGTISATANPTSDGIRLQGNGGVSTTTIKIGESGVVAGYGDGIDSNHNLKVTNAGTISGNYYGITLSGNLKATIVNTGLIEATNGNPSAIWIGYADSALVSTISNKGTISGNIREGGGEEITKITNTGSVLGDIRLEGGADALTNSGIVTGIVEMGVGADVASNKGTLLSFDAGDDNDKFSNTGWVQKNILMGNGADTFKNTGQVDGLIYLGDGDDVFTGGNLSETVADENGNDKYSLGGGDDVYHAIDELTKTGGSGSDIVDGGSNIKTDAHLGIFGDVLHTGLTAGGLAAVGVAQVNLDKASATDFMNTGKSGGTFVLDGSLVVAGGGEDIVKGFESVVGTSFADSIVGDGLANYIDGAGGNDFLYGGKGNDFIEGKDGNDSIHGGQGRDKLSGGANSDIFYYTSLGDSTAKFSGRDVIVDYDEALDGLEFAGALAASAFAGVDANFTGATEEVRVLTTNFGWIVELDLDGDQKADMAIDVLDSTHGIVWAAGEFF